MACERYRETLADVAAGAPAPAGVEDHLASCGPCREELRRLRQALAAADAELADLLSAEPSPGLEARIRRAAAEPSPAGRLGWLWPATAAAATLLVALAVWVGRPASPPPRVAVVAGPEGSARVAVPSSPETSPAPRDDVFVAVVPRRRPLPTPAVPVEAEVLVPPGEAEALLRFAAHLRTRAVSPDSLLVADLSAPLPEPKGVEIQRLEIVPLDPAETSGMD
jgi:hypothetical protein